MPSFSSTTPRAQDPP
jgi:hypothetical protein